MPTTLGVARLRRRFRRGPPGGPPGQPPVSPAVLPPVSNSSVYDTNWLAARTLVDTGDQYRPRRGSPRSAQGLLQHRRRRGTRHRRRVPRLCPPRMAASPTRRRYLLDPDVHPVRLCRHNVRGHSLRRRGDYEKHHHLAAHRLCRLHRTIRWKPAILSGVIFRARLPYALSSATGGTGITPLPHSWSASYWRAATLTGSPKRFHWK